MGLPADPQRTPPTRPRTRSGHSREDPGIRRDRPAQRPHRILVVRLQPFPSEGDRCHRVRLCRHSTPWSVPRPVRHRRRHASVHLAGIVTNPTGPWRTQAVRKLLMRLPDDHGFRFLVRDGAGQFSHSFDAVFAGSGITAIRIPPRAPQANALAERLGAHAAPRAPQPHDHLKRTTATPASCGVPGALRHASTPPRPQPARTWRL